MLSVPPPRILLSPVADDRTQLVRRLDEFIKRLRVCGLGSSWTAARRQESMRTFEQQLEQLEANYARYVNDLMADQMLRKRKDVA